MARITITRALSVRRYEDHEFDTEDLTPEQVAALEEVGAEYRDANLSSDALRIVDELCDDHDAMWEDSDDILEVDERNVDFTLTGE